MYILSEIFLDLDHPVVRRDLANRYYIHKTFSKMFSEYDKVKDYIVFYVQDVGSIPQVTIRSPLEPDWRQLPKGYLLSEPKVEVIEEILEPDKVYHFTWHCHCATSKNRNGKDCRPIKDDKEKISWVEDQGNRNGFTPFNFHLAYTEEITFQKKGLKEVKHYMATFKGFVTIDDIEEFQKKSAKGIGKGRGYGGGLFLLKP